jgi:hypothetical protein
METENKFAQLSIQSNDITFNNFTNGTTLLDFSFPDPSSHFASLRVQGPPPEPSMHRPCDSSPPLSSADEHPPPPVPQPIQPIHQYQSLMHAAMPNHYSLAGGGGGGGGGGTTVGRVGSIGLTGKKMANHKSAPLPQQAYQSEFQLPGTPSAKGRQSHGEQKQSNSNMSNFPTPAHFSLNSPSNSNGSFTPHTYSPNPYSPFPQTPQSPQFQQPAQFLSSAPQQLMPNHNYFAQNQLPQQSNMISIPFSPNTYQTLNQNTNASSNATEMSAFNVHQPSPNQFHSNPNSNFSVNFNTPQQLTPSPSFPSFSANNLASNADECMNVETSKPISPAPSPFSSGNGRPPPNHSVAVLPGQSASVMQNQFGNLQQQQQQQQQANIPLQDGRQTPSSLLQGIYDAMQECKLQLKNILFVQKVRKLLR